MGVHREFCAVRKRLTFDSLDQVAPGNSCVVDVTVSPEGVRETLLSHSTMSGLLQQGDLSGCEPSLSWLLEAAEVGGTLEITQTIDDELYRFQVSVELVEGSPP